MVCKEKRAMSIYLQGKEAELVGIVCGDDAIVEVWTDDGMVWPDITGAAGGVVIEPPASSSDDWPYWQHALSAVETGNVGNTCHLRFTVDGVDYYVNRAPRGKQRVVLEGNVIKLNSSQQAALAGKLGEYVEVQAVVPTRYGWWRQFPYSNSTANRFSVSWNMPLLPRTRFELSGRKGQKREWAYVNFIESVSLPSGYITKYNGYNQITGKGRYIFTVYSPEVQEVVNNDNACELIFNTYGSTYCANGVRPIWPGFKKVFQLQVIAEF